ncbi:MAG: hypothetical protein ACFCUR_01610, partial [Rhodomicrobiaceae bacterium]
DAVGQLDAGIASAARHARRQDLSRFDGPPLRRGIDKPDLSEPPLPEIKVLQIEAVLFRISLHRHPASSACLNMIEPATLFVAEISYVHTAIITR